MMERNMNLTYPVRWYMATSDLDRGLLGHCPYVKKEFPAGPRETARASVEPA